jgi:site-specific recombinase XerD
MEGNLDNKTLLYLREKGLLTEEEYKKLSKNEDKKIPKADLKIRDALNIFNSNLQGYSPGTMSNYRTSVVNFLEYLYNVPEIEEAYDLKLRQINIKDIEGWYNHLCSNGYTFASIRRFKYGIKTFLDVMKNHGFRTFDINRVKIPNKLVVHPTDINALTDDEIKAIADCAKTLRDKVLILFIYETGMRRQEVIECRKKDMNFQKNFVTIYKYNRVDRIGYFSESLKKMILAYLEEWREEIVEINNKRIKRYQSKGERYEILKESEFLFQTVRSPMISYSTIHKVLKETSYEYYSNKYKQEGRNDEEIELLTKQQVNKFSAETLRHSKRAFLFSQGYTAEQVKLLMGDENIWEVKRHLRLAQQIYPSKFRNIP